MAMVRDQHNQLFFNLDVPFSPTQQAVKFNRPEPIMVEKLGCSSAPSPVPVQPSDPTQMAFRFSSVSEDKLSLAVQLARRDLKKQKYDAQMKQKKDQENAAKVKVTKKKSAGMVHANQTKKTSDKKVVKVKERAKGHQVKAKAVQSSRRPGSGKVAKVAPDGLLHFMDDSDMPVVSQSPPTREARQTEEQQHTKEIQRLRKELQKYVTEIEQFENRATQAGIKVDTMDDLEEDEKRRLVVRAEEQAHRSMRMLYVLQQQVREIQEQVRKLSSGEIRHTRKSQAMSKLAAAHRAAVRALQNLITQLPNRGRAQGLPKMYRELTVLIQQLSLCCTQLEVGGQSPLPDSVARLLFNTSAMDETLDGDTDKGHGQPNSPVRKQLLFEEVPPPAIKKEVLVPKQTNKSVKSQVARQSKPQGIGNHTIDRLPSQGNERAIDATPDREHALRAGIAALVRAAGSTPPASPQAAPHGSPVPPLPLPQSPRTPRAILKSPRAKSVVQQGHVPKEVVIQVKDKPAAKKGLLLSNKLKAQRERVAARQVTTETHYADPTVASMLKHKAVEPILESARKTPPVSPRSPRRAPVSPGRGGRDDLHILHSPSRATEKDIHRQAWLDRQAWRQRQELETLKRVEHEKLQSLRKEMGKPEEWVREAEERIKQKLKPILDKAQSISDAYAEMKRTDRYSLRQKLSERASQSVDMNADLLADMILQEVLEDTALELQRLQEEEEEEEEEAMALQDAPSLETMLQRLNEMEEQQNEIRLRWTSLEYADLMTGKTRTAYHDAPNVETPGTPPPIHLTSSIKEMPSQMTEIPRSDEIRQEAIVFTKQKPRTTYLTESLRLAGVLPGGDNEFWEQPGPDPAPQKKTSQKIPIYMTKEMVEGIYTNRERFEQHLQKTAQQPTGKFNPWGLVEQLSDEILADIFHDIAGELDDINTSIVDHVYKTEFTVPQSQQKPGANTANQSSLPIENTSTNHDIQPAQDAS